jgi:hypothetical protein
MTKQEIDEDVILAAWDGSRSGALTITCPANLKAA